MITAAQAKAIAERYQKAVELVEQGKVFPLAESADRYIVVNGENRAHLVDLARHTCDCKDYQYRGREVGTCKHLLAAELYRERHQDGGRGAKPRRRYQCDRCGAVEESDNDLTGARCRRCLLLHPLEPRGRYQPLEDTERCDTCGGGLDGGRCPACEAYCEEAYDGRYVREGDGTVSALW